ncbi:hypothetical protein K5D69_23835, partial [Pseudomonas cichorii]|uniref:hypothetical protein n=1 Tax=Pseudomonas cichorii TaxID=36746 RepID=UPI001C89D356
MGHDGLQVQQGIGVGGVDEQPTRVVAQVFGPGLKVGLCVAHLLQQGFAEGQVFLQIGACAFEIDFTTPLFAILPGLTIFLGRVAAITGTQR